MPGPGGFLFFWPLTLRSQLAKSKNMTAGPGSNGPARGYIRTPQGAWTMPLRLSALAVVCALVFLGPVLADEFTTRITKIEGDQVTFQKKKKGGKDGKA